MTPWYAVRRLIALAIHREKFGYSESVKEYEIGSPPFLRIPYPPILLANPSSPVFFINRNTTVKLSLINTIHVKHVFSFPSSL